MFAEYDDLIDIESLMDMLCIGRNKAYELVNSKEIAACKVGKSWCICQPKIRSKNHSILGHFLVNKCASENCTKAQTF
jgi:hypothetical protein